MTAAPPDAHLRPWRLDDRGSLLDAYRTTPALVHELPQLGSLDEAEEVRP